MTIDRARHGQLICDPNMGDCFRSCLGVILDLPTTAMPHFYDRDWWFQWKRWFDEFGLSLHHASADGPIWKPHRWIASVPSKNFEDRTHAIVMEGHQVLFDPSPKRRYRPRMHMLGQHIVLGGYWLEVADARKLDALGGYRRALKAAG